MARKQLARRRVKVVTKPAVDEVIEVGTGVVATEEVTETEEVAYGTRSIERPIGRGAFVG